MPLVYACIVPHGGELIPALAGRSLRLFGPTRRGMRRVSAQMAEARPDTIVVSTPHGLRLHRRIGVVLSEHSTGRLAEGRRKVALRAACDVPLARSILAESERMGLPVVGANYGSFEGELSDLAMDWGTLVPMWFFTSDGGLEAKLVVVTPSREVALEENVRFGRAVAKVAERGGKRVAFVASADQAHTHRRNGPYGLSPKAAVYDRSVIDAITSDRLKSVLKFPSSLVKEAKPDSLWQMAMLVGVLEEVKMRGELFSYDVPTYYGMLCAGYLRK